MAHEHTKVNRIVCDICESQIFTVSTDLSIFDTNYDENGDCTSTMEQAPKGVEHDYLVVCSLCTPGVVEAWEGMIYTLRSKGA